MPNMINPHKYIDLMNNKSIEYSLQLQYFNKTEQGEALWGDSHQLEESRLEMPLRTNHQHGLRRKLKQEPSRSKELGRVTALFQW